MWKYYVNLYAQFKYTQICIIINNNKSPHFFFLFIFAFVEELYLNLTKLYLFSEFAEKVFLIELIVLLMKYVILKQTGAKSETKSIGNFYAKI